MSHAEIAASQSAAGSPVDVSYAVGGNASGVTFAFDFEKYPIDEKKVPPTFVDVVDDGEFQPEKGPFYTAQLSFDGDEKKDQDFPPKYTAIGNQSPGVEPESALPQYEYTVYPTGGPI
jgi:hypothetical protein